MADLSQSGTLETPRTEDVANVAETVDEDKAAETTDPTPTDTDANTEQTEATNEQTEDTVATTEEKDKENENDKNEEKEAELEKDPSLRTELTDALNDVKDQNIEETAKERDDKYLSTKQESVDKSLTPQNTLKDDSKPSAISTDPIANETKEEEKNEDEESNKLTELRGTPRDETESEKAKKALKALEIEKNKTPDKLNLGNGWNVKQTSKLSKIKGLRGETLHLHTITVNFVITKDVDGQMVDTPHKLLFKHYEKRTGSKVLKTSKEVKLNDRVVYDRKKDKPSSIPYIEVYLENKRPEKVAVLITPNVDEKKKKISYIYEVQVNGEAIHKAYQSWLDQKDGKSSANAKTKTKSKANKAGSKKKGSKKKTASKKKSKK